MSVVQFDSVSKRYGREIAAESVSLSIPANRTTAIIGPSGSGKSTLLQMINGMVRPDAGSVRVFDAPVDYGELPQLRRKIGYAVQGIGLFPHWNVARNIAILAEMNGWDGARRSARVRELMALVELPEHYETRHPHELSGGEMQRVGLCRAMMLDPPLFLLDEPFGALDPLTRGEVHREFERIREAGRRTIVLVTHDLHEAQKLADEIVVVNEGRVEQQAETQTILAQPANDFVAGFFRAYEESR